MSVILFGADELARVLVWYLGRSAIETLDAREVAESLALYSRANARAARATWYRGTTRTPASVRAETRPSSAREIHDAARAIVASGRGVSADDAADTAMLLHYNAVSNDGRDHATRETLAFLLDVVKKVARDARERERYRAHGGLVPAVDR